MKPLTLLLAPLAAAALAPLLIAVLAVTVTAPAVARQLTAYSCTDPTVPAVGGWRVPLEQAYTLTSGFGDRFHPIERAWRLHTGADLATTGPGPARVVAAATGTVTVAGWADGYGNHIRLDHGDGVETRYAHLASIEPAITAGLSVTAGQPLGVEGSTGASTGTHLHYEIRHAATPIDPAPFMTEHAAPLDGRPVPPTTTTTPTTAGMPPGPGIQEGGIGFPLPLPGTPRLASRTTPAAPIPEPVRALYAAAGAAYRIPWTLLAGIGMEETAHGATTATSTAGARGLMQFMPATWAAYGVDGDGDGRADITNPADSIHSAANYLTASGVTRGPDGVRAAVYAYNHADWYVNDVLHYAHTYGGGLIPASPTSCPAGDGDPTLAPLPADRVHALLTWARQHIGDAYVMGGTGPQVWDCSGYTQAAYRHIGITLPRTAAAQHDWLAAGNGHRVPPGQEQPGDLVFTDTYLGPHKIGHVMLVADPTTTTSLEASTPTVGTYDYRRYAAHSIYEIWRVGDLAASSTTGMPMGEPIQP